MSRRSRLASITAICLVTSLVIIAYLISKQSGHRLSVTFGDTSIEITLLGFFAVKIILLLSALLFIIQGFRVHWGWGVANLFLFPLAGIALFLKHRREAKVPMAIWVGGVVSLLLLLLCVKLESLNSEIVGC